MNSGDWIENLTALEFNGNEWSIYKYDASHYKTEGSSKFKYPTRDPEILTEEVGMFLTYLKHPATI